MIYKLYGDKVKHILLITVVCLLCGCNTTVQNTDGGITSSNPDHVKVSEKPNLTEAYLLKDDANNDEVKIKEAIACIQNKKYPQAIGLLSKIKNNKQAEDLLKQLRYIISGTYLANLNAGIAAIDNSGKVKVMIDDTIYKNYGYGETSHWNNINSLSDAQGRLDALDKEGVIHSTLDTDPSYRYVADQLKSYTAISTISTDYDNYVLLSKSGNIYAYSDRSSDALDSYKDKISTWKDVVDVVTGNLRIAALQSDGTVYVADYNKYYDSPDDYLYDEIEDWTDIVDISAAKVGPIAGLKSDGTVVMSRYKLKGINYDYSYDVSSWNDIIAISKSSTSLLGLKRDGTVVATGNNESGQLEVSGWHDIVAIAAGDWISIGLKSDGTLVIAGQTEEGVAMPDISGVNQLYVPNVIY